MPLWEATARYDDGFVSGYGHFVSAEMMMAGPFAAAARASHRRARQPRVSAPPVVDICPGEERTSSLDADDDVVILMGRRLRAIGSRRRCHYAAPRAAHAL